MRTLFSSLAILFRVEHVISGIPCPNVVLADDTAKAITIF
jgi:hypothetical protein